MDLDEVQEIAARLGSTVYLATLSDGGYPNIAPIAVSWRDGVAYMATNASSHKVRHIRRDPRVSFHTAVGQATGFDQLSVRGTAAILQDTASRERLWGAFDYDLAAFFGTKENPDLCFIAVQPERVLFLLQMGQGGRKSWRSA